MKQVCAGCKTEKFIIGQGLCSSCLMAAKFIKATKPQTLAVEAELTARATPEPTVNGTTEPDQPQKKYVCDNCDKAFPTATDLTKLDTRVGKLYLCAKCYASEKEALDALRASEASTFDPKNYKTWPRCTNCHAHVKEPIDGLCSNCQKKPAKVDLLVVRPTDSNKYQEFFNQETQSITDLFSTAESEDAAIAQLRQLIIDGAADLLSKEAEAFRAKTLQQARKVKYNAILSKLSLDKQNELRIEDEKYVPQSGVPKKLKSPMAQMEKQKKLKKSLEDKINEMFGGRLTVEEINEKKKALGL